MRNVLSFKYLRETIKEGGDWGSCQYDEASRTYEVTHAFLRQFKTVALGIEFLRNELGCKIEIDVPKSIEAAINDFFTTEAEEIEENPDYSALWAECKAQSLVRYGVTPEAMFNCVRDCSWDLWSAAPVIAAALGVIIEDAPRTTNVMGPLGNQMVQSENFQVGLYCALLMHLGLVKDPLVFSDFDT